MSGFDIVIEGYSTSVNEWAKAKRASRDELPNLTNEQKAFVRRFGISEEDYARSVLAGRYGSERLGHEAKRFSHLLQEAVDSMKGRADIEITMVVFSAFRREFTCHLREGSKEFSCHISSVRVADHLDSGDPKLKQNIKQMLTERVEQARAEAVGASR